FELVEGRSISAFGDDVVSGCDQMTGVEAYTDASRVLQPLDDRGQMLESVPDGSTLSCGVFEQHHRRTSPLSREHGATSVGDQGESIVFRAGCACAGMQYHAEQAQRMGPIEFIGQRFDGLRT